jgi:hypothetical protein
MLPQRAECIMSAIQRMIDEMKRRGYANKTIKEYSGSLRRMATYFGCCPSELTLEQIREYQVHLARRKDISTSYYNATVTALRFMYLQTLERDWSIERLPYGRREHRLPVVLSRPEVFGLWRPLRHLFGRHSYQQLSTAHCDAPLPVRPALEKHRLSPTLPPSISIQTTTSDAIAQMSQATSQMKPSRFAQLRPKQSA